MPPLFFGSSIALAGQQAVAGLKSEYEKLDAIFGKSSATNTVKNAVLILGIGILAFFGFKLLKKRRG